LAAQAIAVRYCLPSGLVSGAQQQAIARGPVVVIGSEGDSIDLGLAEPLGERVLYVVPPLEGRAAVDRSA
jgi:hypothetical protein